MSTLQIQHPKGRLDYMLHYLYLTSHGSKFTSTLYPELLEDEGHTMVMTCMSTYSVR